jgi:hypothetical protein
VRQQDELVLIKVRHSNADWPREGTLPAGACCARFRHRIAGQLARRWMRPSGKVDRNGNPVPVRRHHPERPERTRPGRFSLGP